MARLKPTAILEIFIDLVAEVADGLSDLDDWGHSGVRADQYNLLEAGFRVLSEESGLVGEGEITVVVDPVDGSTNASRALPWYATSLCAVDERGPLVAEVANLATGDRFRAIRGMGAEADQVVLQPTGCVRLADALVAVSGLPPAHGGWAQYRAFGAAALDLCGVAAGTFDGYVDINRAHGVWDYLGALLVCQEAGVPMVDADGRDLLTFDPVQRRGPVAAATPELLEELLAMLRAW
jgi:myo-inositol-1(or 4)-monophosphatase